MSFGLICVHIRSYDCTRIFLHRTTNDVYLCHFIHILLTRSVYFYILSDKENVATNRNRMTAIGHLVEYSDIDMNRRFDIVVGSRSSTSLLLPGTTNCLRYGDVAQQQQQQQRNSHHHYELREDCPGRRDLTTQQKPYVGSNIVILWCRTEDIAVLRPNQFLIRSWRERWVNICSGTY